MGKDVKAGEREPPPVDGSGLRVAVVCGRFNALITDRLLEGALAGLGVAGLADDAVTIEWVPGAFEIPLAAKAFAESGQVDAVVALGAVIRGETGHYDFVAGECARGIQDAQLATGVPIVFGVLTVDTVDQAMERSEPGEQGDNKGGEAAQVALEMAALLARINPA